MNYDLSLKENVAWQASLAKKYGIYGFGVYHYWFNNEKNLLTKPAEIIRDNKDIDFNYFLAWDNGNWKRSWSNVSGNAWSPLSDAGNKSKGPEILIPYILGEEKDWENHFQSVCTHFKEDRYIKINNCPVFIIFNYSADIHRMCEYWDVLAKKSGFDGMHFIFRNSGWKVIPEKQLSGKTLHVFNYEPQSSGWTGQLTLIQRIKRKLYQKLGISLLPTKYQTYDYDTVWNRLLERASTQFKDERYYHGAFVEYDDTPRRGTRGGKVIEGSTPDKFEQYLCDLLKISQCQQKEFVFLTAWNEWGEGAYLEPDTINKYEYLKAASKAIAYYEEK